MIVLSVSFPALQALIKEKMEYYYNIYDDGGQEFAVERFLREHVCAECTWISGYDLNAIYVFDFETDEDFAHFLLKFR